MVITVSCPSCSSSFPVDSNKIPAKGVNARCSSCGDIFRIEKPTEAAAAAPAVAAPAAPAFTAPDPVPEPLPPPVVPEPPVEVAEPLPPPAVPDLPPPPVPDTPAVQEPVAAAPPPPEPEPEAEAASSGFRFGKRDPTDKAKRLARVLVSDMIMYNADRHATAIEGGTLKEDFEEEIEKSWKEFVEQVGQEIAEGPGRQFWSEALNDILAKGEQLF